MSLADTLEPVKLILMDKEFIWESRSTDSRKETWGLFSFLRSAFWASFLYWKELLQKCVSQINALVRAKMSFGCGRPKWQPPIGSWCFFESYLGRLFLINGWEQIWCNWYGIWGVNSNGRFSVWFLRYFWILEFSLSGSLRDFFFFIYFCSSSCDHFFVKFM